MKTLDTQKVGRESVNAKDILSTLQRLEKQKAILEEALNIVGIREVREVEARESSTHRRSPHRGFPNQLFQEVIKHMDGDFTIKQLISEARKHKMGAGKTIVMNSVQSLIKKGLLKIIHSGKGRAVAVYGMNKTETPLKKEVKTVETTK